jgi:4-methyl-5(b-hydroxyethyl)-thiazole monophosphate biosynthesis
MKLLMLFADGFEDVEAVATRDVLVRAGIEVVDARIKEDETVISSHKMYFSHFKRLSEVDFAEFSGIILPGGSRGVNNLLNSDEVIKTVKEFANSNKLVCAICAAPMVLNKAGLLKGKDFTCYPGCEVELEGNYTGKEVVVLEKMITARSMLYSIPFGLAIIEKLLGKEISSKIYQQIAGIR